MDKRIPDARILTTHIATFVHFSLTCGSACVCTYHSKRLTNGIFAEALNRVDKCVVRADNLRDPFRSYAFV